LSGAELNVQWRPKALLFHPAPKRLVDWHVKHCTDPAERKPLNLLAILINAALTAYAKLTSKASYMQNYATTRIKSLPS